MFTGSWVLGFEFPGRVAVSVAICDYAAVDL